MRACVCMHACVCIRVCVCVYIDILLSIVCVCGCTCVCTHTCITYASVFNISIYYIQVLLKTIDEGTVHSADDVFSLCERLTDNKMKFCPGISEEEYTQFHDVLRYDQKSVVITEEPFKRVCSVRFKLWFPIARSCNKAQKQALEVTCSECVRLKVHLKNSSNRIAAMSPSRKVQHQQSSSTYPLKYLSPTSRKIREMNRKAERLREKRIIKKYTPDEIDLDDEQHEDMCRMHATIEEVANDELQRIMSDAPSKAIRDVLLQAWESDSRKCFAADQEKNGMYSTYNM